MQQPSDISSSERLVSPVGIRSQAISVFKVMQVILEGTARMLLICSGHHAYCCIELSVNEGSMADDGKLRYRIWLAFRSLSTQASRLSSCLQAQRGQSLVRAVKFGRRLRKRSAVDGVDSKGYFLM